MNYNELYLHSTFGKHQEAQFISFFLFVALSHVSGGGGVAGSRRFGLECL